MSKMADKRVSPPCPKCKKKLALKVGDLRPGRKVVCPSCAAEIAFTGANVGAAVDSLDAAIKKAFKK